MSVRNSPSVEPYANIQDDLRCAPQGMTDYDCMWDFAWTCAQPVRPAKGHSLPEDMLIKLRIAGRRELDKLPHNRPWVSPASRAKTRAETVAALVGEEHRNRDSQEVGLLATRKLYVEYFAKFGITVGK